MERYKQITGAVLAAFLTFGCGGGATLTVRPTEHPLVQSIPEQTELTAYFPFSEDDLATIRASLPTDQEWVLVLDDQPFSGEAIQGFAAGRAMPIALPRAGGGAPTLIRSGEALAGAKIIGFAIEATAAGSVLAALNLFVNPQITQCAIEGCYIQYVDANMQLAYRPLTVQEMTENGLVYATIGNLTKNGALEGLVEMDESQLGQDPEDKIENGTPAPQEPPGPTDREQIEGERSEQQPRPPRKVLVVEDSPDFAHTISGIFKDGGVEVVVVNSVEAAEAALREGGFTEILTDGLLGDWVGVVDISGDIPVRLLTGSYNYYKDLAEQRNIPILDKEDFDWMEAVLEEPLAQTP